MCAVIAALNPYPGTIRFFLKLILVSLVCFKHAEYHGTY